MSGKNEELFQTKESRKQWTDSLLHNIRNSQKCLTSSQRWIIGKTYIQDLEYLRQFLYIFVLFEQYIMIFFFYLSTFSNTSSNRFSIIFLSHLNIIYLFIIYSYFNLYPHTPISTHFFANFLLYFILLLINSSISSLENDCQQKTF